LAPRPSRQVHRAVTLDGRDVAIKVLRPGIEAEFARAIETYEWAAARAEAAGGEIARLRPPRGDRLFQEMDAA
jgi:ubiquinone biosynthesis protein